jgi:hypothetical protein
VSIAIKMNPVPGYESMLSNSPILFFFDKSPVGSIPDPRPKSNSYHILGIFVVFPYGRSIESSK